MLWFVIIINSAALVYKFLICRNIVEFKIAEVVFKEVIVRMPLKGREKLIRRLRFIYGDRYDPQIIEDIKNRQLKKYALAWITFSFLVIASQMAYSGGAELPSHLGRPDHGEGYRTVPAEVEIDTGAGRIKKNVDLRIKEKSLSQSQKKAILSGFAETLPTLVLADNANLKYVSRSLHLPEKGNDGILVSWKSSRPDIVREDGFVDTTRLIEPERVELTADCELEGLHETTVINLTAAKELNDYYTARLIPEKIDQMIKTINLSEGTKDYELPGVLEGGHIISWRTRPGNGEWILLLTLLAGCTLIHLNRYRGIERKANRKKQAMISAYPDFISKFNLLLNAGLVVSAAIEKISDDHDRAEAGAEDPLYEELANIVFRVRNSNSCLSNELQLFAERCRIPEFLRFSMIISENISKGALLEEKLESENEALWHMQKKRAEELGRIADTKMTFPLMLLLLSLIIITVGPAMINI